MLLKRLLIASVIFASISSSVSAMVCTTLFRSHSRGSTDGEVVLLQQFLFDGGYLTTKPNGIFGTGTVTAVKKFQVANGISPVGSVGPMTRAKVKEVSCTKVIVHHDVFFRNIDTPEVVFKKNIVASKSFFPEKIGRYTKKVNPSINQYDCNKDGCFYISKVAYYASKKDFMDIVISISDKELIESTRLLKELNDNPKLRPFSDGVFKNCIITESLGCVGLDKKTVLGVTHSTNFAEDNEANRAVIDSVVAKKIQVDYIIKNELTNYFVKNIPQSINQVSVGSSSLEVVNKNTTIYTAGFAKRSISESYPYQNTKNILSSCMDTVFGPRAISLNDTDAITYDEYSRFYRCANQAAVKVDSASEFMLIKIKESIQATSPELKGVLNSCVNKVLGNRATTIDDTYVFTTGEYRAVTLCINQTSSR